MQSAFGSWLLAIGRWQRVVPRAVKTIHNATARVYRVAF